MMFLVVWLSVLISALAQVAVVHWHRDLLQEWQVVNANMQVLRAEHTRLVLEKSALMAHGRIDLLARERLQMISPTQPQVLQP